MPADTLRIYHNPRCSKSRQTLALLEEGGVAFEVVEYLQDTPSVEELSELANKLGRQPLEFTRTKEAAFAALDPPGADRSREEMLEALSAHPILIERPIVVRGDRAVLGRPPENVLALLDG